MDRKQTASPVAVNEVEVEVDVEVVEANAVGPAAGILLRAFSWVTYNLIIPFKTFAVRIKIIIVALVIGLVWKGGKVSDNGASSTVVWPLFTAMLDGKVWGK
ncbi:MAG TPA: hypothetical protein VJM47_02670 [Nitrosospira sp.]|nr:hypothetical protein [Nitrosospira sp.]